MKNFSYEADFYRFLYKDEILRLTYINGPISLDIAKEVVAKRLELTKGNSVLLLIDDESLKGIDPDARDFLSSKDGVEGLKAAALLSGNYFSQHLANFFLKISFKKQTMPARVFRNEDEAIGWLKKHQ